MLFRFPVLLWVLFIAIPTLVFSQSATDDSPSLTKPTGPYTVGQVLIDLTDSSRPEPGTSRTDDHREIPLQIWYPTFSDAEGAMARYRPRVEALRSDWGDEAVDFYRSVATSWIADAPMSEDGPFPVVIFSHGWSARSSSHGTFLSNLASLGFVVVGVNHPFLGKVVLASGDVTEPNDSQFENQAEANAFYAADVSFVIDELLTLNKKDRDRRFTGKLDPMRIAAAGHSSGFPAVSSAAVRDRRIKALISFDAGVPKIVRKEGLDIPILLVRADSSAYTDLFFRGKDINPKGTIYDVDFFRVHRGDFYDLVIDGTTHNSIYDEYLFAENEAERVLSIRNHELIAAYAAAFLARYLNDSEAGLLDVESEQPPSVTLRFIPAPPD